MDAATAQTAAPVSASTLQVAGDVASALSLTPAAMKELPRTRVEVKDEGRTVIYEGVLVGEILTRAGAPMGAGLRGNAIASYVLASASDGYQVVFSLAELDPAFTSNDIIVADTIGRLPDLPGLPEPAGRFPRVDRSQHGAVPRWDSAARCLRPAAMMRARRRAASASESGPMCAAAVDALASIS